MLLVPCVHRPWGSSLSNSENKSNAAGRPASQNDAGLAAATVPELNSSFTIIITDETPSGQTPPEVTV